MKSSLTKVSIFKVLGLRQRRERQFLFSILREGRQSRMEKIKDTTAASYNLDGNLCLQPKLHPLGAFVILFHLFGTLQSKKTKIFCFVCQFKPMKPNLYFEQTTSHTTHNIWKRFQSILFKLCPFCQTITIKSMTIFLLYPFWNRTSFGQKTAILLELRPKSLLDGFLYLRMVNAPLVKCNIQAFEEPC